MPAECWFSQFVALSAVARIRRRAAALRFHAPCCSSTPKFGEVSTIRIGSSLSLSTISTVLSSTFATWSTLARYCEGWSLRLMRRLKRPHHVVGRHRVAAVELHAVAQREAPALAVRRARPGGREAGLHVDVVAGRAGDAAGRRPPCRSAASVYCASRAGSKVMESLMSSPSTSVALLRLREDALRQPGSDRRAAHAEQPHHFAPPDPAKLFRHAFPPAD